MAFPEFDPGFKKVLFFSRGRGRGHVIPDMEIASELAKIRGDLQIRFASYGTGARTLEAFDVPHIDLRLQDINGISETTVAAGKIIGWLDPGLVVSHEEFAALPAAKIFDKPTILLTDWFTDLEKNSMQSLRFADEIVFVDDPGHFDEPPWVSGKVHYVGRILRRFDYTRRDRDRARDELALPALATVISVLPGSWTEQMVPSIDVILPAFDLLDRTPKHLIWVAGADRDLILSRLNGRSGVRVVESDWKMDRLMAASDVAITKCNRKTLLELDWLGVPSISISHGSNPIDEKRADHLPLNRKLSAREATPDSMVNRINEALRPQERIAATTETPRPDGAAKAAKILSRILDGPLLATFSENSDHPSLR